LYVDKLVHSNRYWTILQITCSFGGRDYTTQKICTGV